MLFFLLFFVLICHLSYGGWYHLILKNISLVFVCLLPFSHFVPRFWVLYQLDKKKKYLNYSNVHIRMALWQLKDYVEMYYKQATPPTPTPHPHGPHSYLTLQKVVQQVHATGPLVSLVEFWERLRQYMRDKCNTLFSSLDWCASSVWPHNWHRFRRVRSKGSVSVWYN